MAIALKFGQLSHQLLLRNSGSLYNAVRYSHDKKMVPFHYAWKPAPAPKTEEERIKAAEKYNMHPSEYEPFPDTHGAYGDYPKLPLQGYEARDPHYPYDNPAFRLNYNEPLNYYMEGLTGDRFEHGVEFPVPLKKCIITLASFLTCYIGLYFLTKPYPHFQAVMEKQYPKPGVVHYTFEPAQ